MLASYKNEQLPISKSKAWASKLKLYYSEPIQIKINTRNK